MDPEKVQKKVTDERTREDNPTSAKKKIEIQGSALAFFHLCLVS